MAVTSSSTLQSSTIPEPLQSHLLLQIPWVRHGLTYRVEGMGKADGNIGLGSPRDADDAWQMRQLWCSGMGLDASKIVTMGQVHGNDVIRVFRTDAGTGARDRGTSIGIADALITNDPDVVLVTLHADCQPILLVDPVQRAVAAVHAGWRGTVADVGGHTVAAMQREFGSNPADLLAFLGPAIGPVANEVGDEVIEAWLTQAHDLEDTAQLAVLKPGPKYHFDVPTANRLLLRRAGLLDEHIETSPICTKSNTDSWFSHRGHGPNAGREGALIAIVGDAS